MQLMTYFFISSIFIRLHAQRDALPVITEEFAVLNTSCLAVFFKVALVAPVLSGFFL